MRERHGDEAELQAIDSVRERHVGALNAGDAAAWTALFAEDGVQMPPNAPANVGRDRIGAWSGGMLAAFRATFALTVAEIRAVDGWAFERGAYAIGLTPAAGGPAMRDDGKYVTIYRKDADGAWRISHDIWNSDAPPPAG